MKDDNTYVLIPNHRRAIGDVVDVVTERWQEDDRWVVGDRNQKTGTVDFRHRSYESLAEVCAVFGLNVRDVRKRIVPADAGELQQSPLPTLVLEMIARRGNADPDYEHGCRLFLSCQPAPSDQGSRLYSGWLDTHDLAAYWAERGVELQAAAAVPLPETPARSSRNLAR